ncbi:MAG: sialate O-acetylesterase [Verrucomicrobiota bacterium JB024]|nr:sialate O-acetylesterase [Verrucomicrobiota bacterium JB024]
MINPIIPYAISGVIWYQGESNAERAYQYRTSFPLMIEDWRNRWNQGNFSFYFVQLANYKDKVTEPVESSWAELREAQNLTLSQPKTGRLLSLTWASQATSTLATKYSWGNAWHVSPWRTNTARPFPTPARFMTP